MATVAFWAAAVLLAQTYFLYPLWLLLLARLRPAPRGVPSRTQPWPAVSLVVAAHDEAGCIEEKLRNSLQLDYPPDRLEVLIGSDGSTDGTDALVRSYPDPRVRLSAAARAGKTSVLNRCIPAARGDIVVLSDANTRIEPEALRALVRHFEDPRVARSAGGSSSTTPPGQEYEESAYWKYESWLKVLEGKQGAVVGPTAGSTPSGGSSSPRCRPRPSWTTSSFLSGCSIRGTASSTSQRRWPRRRPPRTTAGSSVAGRVSPRGTSRAWGWCRGCSRRSAGFPAFAFWSHKVLRWCAPALMLVALVANAVLLDQPFYRVTMAAQVGFYALAMLGSVAVGPSLVRRVAGVAYYFVTMNLAIAVGFWRFLRNSQAAAWERTARA